MLFPDELRMIFFSFAIAVKNKLSCLSPVAGFFSCCCPVRCIILNRADF